MPASRLACRHLSPIRRDRRHHRGGSCSGIEHGPDQGRCAGPLRPCGQVQPAPEDRKRACRSRTIRRMERVAPKLGPGVDSRSCARWAPRVRQGRRSPKPGSCEGPGFYIRETDASQAWTERARQAALPGVLRDSPFRCAEMVAEPGRGLAVDDRARGLSCRGLGGKSVGGYSPGGTRGGASVRTPGAGVAQYGQIFQGSSIIFPHWLHGRRSLV